MLYTLTQLQLLNMLETAACRSRTLSAIDEAEIACRVLREVFDEQQRLMPYQPKVRTDG